MIKYWVAYHREHAEGPFSRERFRTAHTGVKAGDVLFVILGDNRTNTNYFLAGRFEVISIGDSITKKGKKQYTFILKSKDPNHTRIALNETSGFSKEDIRREYINGTGLKPAKHPYIDDFEKALKDYYSVSLVDKAIADKMAGTLQTTLMQRQSSGTPDHSPRQSGLKSNEAKVEMSEISDLMDLFSKDLPATTKEQLIHARLGQGKFRQNVIATWKGERCAVTGISLTEVLIASHIIPWSESENLRLEGTNGILLCSHLDRLFDRYLISFSSEGCIVFSKNLSGSSRIDLEKLGINKLCKLNTDGLSPNDKAGIFDNLSVHRQRLIDLENER